MFTNRLDEARLLQRTGRTSETIAAFEAFEAFGDNRINTMPSGFA